jgi:uncharacterized LabA/DUF88 family protein
VYVDVANLSLSGGYRLRYNVLRQFACRDGAIPQRLNAYVAYDPLRARQDSQYRARSASFHAALREQGYKVITRPVEWHENSSGRYARSDADLDLALDAMLECRNLDRVVLASGDGDFARLVRLLQERGCRVEVVGLDNVSLRLRRAADLYLSGYVIPGLIPLPGEKVEHGSPNWGEVGSSVRGWCVQMHNNYGFLRFLKSAWPLLTADVFFHASHLPPDLPLRGLPGQNLVFEFSLQQGQDGLYAQDIRLVDRRTVNHKETTR